MIVHAEILHYKSIAEARLDFKPLNVVVGLNGVGKSNLVDALYFLHDCVVEDLDTAVTKRHGIDSLRQWSKTKPYHVTVDLHFKRNDEYGRYKVVLGSTRGGYQVLEEYGEWYGRPLIFHDDRPQKSGTSSFHRGVDGVVSQNVFWADKPASTVKMATADLYITALSGAFSNIASYSFRPIVQELTSFTSYSIYPNTLRKAQEVSRQETLSSDGSNLATVIRKLNSGRRKNKEEVLSTLRTVLPITSDLIVKSAGGFYVPVLRVKEPTGDIHELNMSQVSDGTLRLLGLLTAFYQTNRPEKIAVEEPEQMIHPGALPVIADAAKDYVAGESVSQNQLFMTTHSPMLLDYFDADSIIGANFVNGVTQCGRVSERQKGLIRDQLFTPGEILVSEGFF